MGGSSRVLIVVSLAVAAFAAQVPLEPRGGTASRIPCDASLASVCAESTDGIVATIVVDDTAFAVLPGTPPTLVRLRERVHRAFGVSGGLFAFTPIDENGYPSLQLHVLNFATSREEPVLAGVFAGEAAWRPNTPQIAVLADSADGSHRVVIYDVRTGDRRETATEYPTGDVFRWTADGAELVTTSEAGSQSEAEPEAREVLIRRLDESLRLVSEVRVASAEALRAAARPLRSSISPSRLRASPLRARLGTDSGSLSIEREDGSAVLTRAYPEWALTETAIIVKTFSPSVTHHLVRLDQGTSEILATSAAVPTFKLPWPKPTTEVASQGNGTGSHTGAQKWAYDFAMTGSDHILAAAAGTVVEAKGNITCNTAAKCCPDYSAACAANVTDLAGGGFGNYVIIAHSGDRWTLYAHMVPNSVRVVAGQTVKQGHYLGNAGHTGSSYSSQGASQCSSNCTATSNSCPASCGDHLHFQVQTGRYRYSSSEEVDFAEQSSPLPLAPNPLTSDNAASCTGPVTVGGGVSNAGNGAPVSGASIVWGDCSDVTSPSGGYVFSPAPCQTALLKVTKDGYQTYSQYYTAACNSSNNKNVSLTPESLQCVAPTLGGIETAAGCTVPSVTTVSPIDVKTTSATFRATVTNDGGSSIIDRRFEWGVYPSWSDATNLNGGTIVVSGNTFSYAATGLIPDTLYQIRAWAKNGAGWAPLANSISFRTAAVTPPSCTSFTIDPTAVSPSAGASSRSVAVIGSSPAGCKGGSWSTSSNASWLSVGPSKGSGVGSATVLWTANPSPSARTGAVTIANRTFSVVQSGTAPTTCTSFSIDPASVTPSASAGSRAVAVVGSPNGCIGGSWSTNDTSSWLSVSPASGTGPGMATVGWTANPQLLPRSDSVSIAGKTFSVVQSATHNATGGEPHAFIEVPGSEHETHDMGVGPDGAVYVLLRTLSPKSLRVVKSTDGGVTWGTPVSVPDSTFTNSYYAMAVDSGGTVHVVWSESTTDQPYYSRSTDGGSTFSAPQGVRRGRSYNGYRPTNATTIAVGADGVGNVYVAYSARTEDSSGDFVGYGVWVSQSTNGGSSFQNEFPADSPSYSHTRPIRVRATPANLYMLYLDTDTNDLYFYRRDADEYGGNSGRVNETQGAAEGYAADFVVAPDERTFYVTYSDDTEDWEGDVLFCKSTSGGLTWSGCKRLNDSKRRVQDSPTMDRDAGGGLHVAWKDLREGGDWHIYYVYSADDGATFTINFNVSAPSADLDFNDPHLMIDNAAAAVYVSAGRDVGRVVVARLPVVGHTAAEVLPVPITVTADAVSIARIDVTWTADPNAAWYQVERRAAGGEFTEVGATLTNSYSDTSVVPDAAYLYRVRAINDAGASPESEPDLATTFTYVDDPLPAGTRIKASHVSQLRNAVNTVRALADLGPATYTNTAAPGTRIRAADLQELRFFLDSALAALGIPISGYQDPELGGRRIKTVHLQELRDRTR